MGKIMRSMQRTFQEQMDSDRGTTTFNTPYNYVYNMEKGSEKVDPISLTVPDQALSVAEIMRRYTQGRPIEVNNNLTYTGGDQLYPDVRKMDLVELDQMKEALAEDVKKGEKTMKAFDEQKKSKVKAEQKKKDEAERSGGTGRRYIDQPLPFDKSEEGGSGGTAQQVPPEEDKK